MKKSSLKRFFSFALILALTVCLFAGCGNSAQKETPAAGDEAAKPIELKWGYHYPSGTPTAIAIDEFCAKVGEVTEGRVTITPYHDAVLGAAGDALSLVASGVADIVWTSTAIFNGQFPYSDILGLPMLGLGDALVGTNAMWDLMEQFPEAFAEEYANYHVLMMHMSPANVVGTKKTIASLEDMSGLNIRAGAGSPTAMATRWGAAPVAVATPEMYTSLQKGVIDGYIFDGSGIATWGLAELTECMIDAGFGFNVCPVLMSPKAWDSISAEDQAAITELAGREGSLLLAAAMQGEADEMLETYTGEYTKYAPGDGLYEELQAPLNAYVDEWAQTMTTETIDAAAMVEYLRNFNK